LSAEFKISAKEAFATDFKSLKKADNTNLSGEKLHGSGSLRGRNNAAKTKAPPCGGAKFLMTLLLLL
jgi:hypothetical protein